MFRDRFKSTYVDLEGGFWGLIGRDGKQYFILNMPEQLKENGKKFTVSLKVLDGASMSMWGTAAEVVGFSTS